MRNAPMKRKETTMGAAGKALGSRAAFIGAIVLAVAVRLANLKAFSGSPLANHLQLDQEAYDSWAQRIAAGEWIGQGVFWVDPLYAYVLAVIYKLLGHGLTLVRTLQCALGVGSVVLAGSIARSITGRVAVGHGAMLVAALFIPLLHNEVQIEKASLTAFLFAAALAVYLRGTRRAIVVAGLLTGLAVLGRGNILLAVPLGALALLLDRPSGTRKSASFYLERESIRRAVLFAGAAFAVIGVLTVRNLIVTGEFLLTTSIGGPSLYSAQVRGHDSGTYQPPDFVRSATQYEHDDFHAEAERRVGRRMSDTEVNAYWAREARREMLADPAATISRSLRKLRLALHQYEVPDNDSIEIAADYSPVLRLPIFWFGQVFPFALLGMIAWWRRSRKARITAGAVGVYLLGLVIFYVMGRLRLPMTIPVIALAAAGADWLLEQARSRGRLNRAVSAAAFVVVGLVLSIASPDWLQQMRSRNLAVSYNNLGSQFLAAGRNEYAIGAYEKAIATEPTAVIGAMRTLAELYLKSRRYADAERLTQLVLHYRPTSQLGLRAAVRLYETMANDPAGPGAEVVRDRLVAAYRAAGRTAEAEALGRVAPRPPSAPDSASAAGYTFDGPRREAFINVLRAAAPGSPAWIVATAVDPGAIALSEELARAFAQAGWRVGAPGRTEIPVRAGLFLFVGEEKAPAYVGIAQRALGAASLSPTYATGYRSYYEQMARTRPGFRGFPLAADQTFVLVVGRVP
jgi:tetratricopeptide (TPR) repeat protein